MAIRLRMRTPTEIRRTLARVANMALNNEIDTKTANTIILACNAVLSAMDQFYDVYGIEEGDGMYCAPEERPKIW